MWGENIIWNLQTGAIFWNSVRKIDFSYRITLKLCKLGELTKILQLKFQYNRVIRWKVTGWSVNYQFLRKPNGALRIFQVWEFLASESPLKMMKNAFYFNLRALFVLKIFKFLSWLFSHAGNSLCRKKRLISKLMASQSGKHTITIHITPDISKSKGNQTMKIDKNFSWKIIHKRSYSQPFLKHQNWAYLCIIVWIFIQFVLLYLQVDEYQNILKPQCWPLAFTFYKSFFLEKHDFLRGIYY